MRAYACVFAFMMLMPAGATPVGDVPELASGTWTAAAKSESF